MFQLLVLSVLLVSCLADPLGRPSWFSEPGRQPGGCANLAEGWRACARLDKVKTLAPHGRDCSLFFYCYGNARPACRKCPGGLYFNPQLQVCDWPKNVNCTLRPHHNSTTPYPTTANNNTTVTVIDNSTATVVPTSVTDRNTNNGTTTEAASTASVTDGTTNNGTTTETTSTSVPDGTTTEAASTTSVTDGTTNNGTTTDGTTADGYTTVAVFSWRNYIPWGRK